MSMGQKINPRPNGANDNAVLSDDVVNQIIQIAGDACPLDPDERRSRQRFPIYCCMQLAPLRPDGSLLAHEVETVVGKDISTNGISFSHDTELPCQRLVISLELIGMGHLSVEAEIMWSRQSLIGLYESGCRLIRKVAPQQQ